MWIWKTVCVKRLVHNVVHAAAHEHVKKEIKTKGTETNIVSRHDVDCTLFLSYPENCPSLWALEVTYTTLIILIWFSGKHPSLSGCVSQGEGSEVGRSRYKRTGGNDWHSLTRHAISQRWQITEDRRDDWGRGKWLSLSYLNIRSELPSWSLWFKFKVLLTFLKKSF